MFTPPAALEAILFAAGEPVDKKRLASLLDISVGDLSLAAEALDEMLSGRGLDLVETTEELEIRTSPEAAPLVKKLWEAERSRDLGKAGLETLAVIAYGAGGESAGGTTRGEIDWVRGVNSSASLRTLLLRGLIEGKEDPRDKRRIRYTLTTDALAHLGVKRLDELPRHAELAHDTKDVIAASTEAEREG
jgi:segregation and condensation protein B